MNTYERYIIISVITFLIKKNNHSLEELRKNINTKIVNFRHSVTWTHVKINNIVLVHKIHYGTITYVYLLQVTQFAV